MLENKQIAERIHKNAEYHHTLTNELDELLKPTFIDDEERHEFVSDIVPTYIETTWK